MAVGIGVVAALGVPFVVGEAVGEHSWVPILGVVVALAVGFPFFRLALPLLRRSRRLAVPSAEVLLAADQRPPVLYLRSFDQDERASDVDWDVGSNTLLLSAFWPLALYRLIKESRGSSEEDHWTSAMARVGPVIAIGAPGQLPFSGAARIYVDDKDWQERVLNLMRRAELVVVVGGVTDGLWWEISQALRSSPERLVFMLPNDTHAYEAFRLRLGRELGVEIGDRPRVQHALTVCGLVRLAGAGATEVVPVWGSSRTSITMAFDAAIGRSEVAAG